MDDGELENTYMRLCDEMALAKIGNWLDERSNPFLTGMLALLAKNIYKLQDEVEDLKKQIAES